MSEEADVKLRSEQIVHLNILGGGSDRDDLEGEYNDQVFGIPDFPKYPVTRTRSGYLVASARDIPILDFDYTKGWAYECSFSRFGEIIKERLHDYLNSYRLYRTYNGYRVIVTEKLIDVMDFDFSGLEDIGADALYNKLCVKYGYFRARVGPKPIRMGLPALYEVFDTKTWLSELDNSSNSLVPAEQVRAFNSWLDKYLYACNEYKVCEFIEGWTTEKDRDQDKIQKFIHWHDWQVFNFFKGNAELA